MRDIIKVPKNGCNFSVINYDIFCKRVSAHVDACALIVYLPHGYREKWSYSGICMLRSSVTGEKPVAYVLGALLSLHLSFRGGVLRKLVLV